jgi:hypothetical protein
VQQTADREKAKAYAAQYYQKRKRPSTNMMSR